MRPNNKTKEIPIGDPFYYPRTCGWKNKKKNAKLIMKALNAGVLGSFTGVAMIKEIDIDQYQQA